MYATAVKTRHGAGMRVKFLFLLLAPLVAALVNPGNFGAIDTVRRLQVARWIRLGAPEVNPSDTGFGIAGRNGKLHAYTGIGQSLVLIPFDALVGAVVTPQLTRFPLDAQRQSQVVEMAIAFLMQSAVTAGVLALAYELLLTFGFTSLISAAGALALLFGTTCLQYVQCAQENSLLLLTALCALWSIRRYHATNRATWASIAGLACALAILTRLSSLLEAGIFLAFALVAGQNRKRFLTGFLPPLAAAFAFDRWYQYYRFGDVFSTYMGIAGRQLRPAGAPPSYPFSYPFWKGFFGTLFSADKSIFLFDPLLVALLLLVLVTRRRLDQTLKQVLGWLALLEALYIVSSARYFAFGGDVAWGHRYVLMPVQLLCLFAVPILIREATAVPAWSRRAAWALVAASVILQAASTAIAPNLEVEQRRLGYDRGVVWNRAVNIYQISLDRQEPSRFNGIPIEWRTLYYLPFQLRFRFPALARWAIPAWLALSASVPFVVFAILRTASGSKPARQPGSQVCHP